MNTSGPGISVPYMYFWLNTGRSFPVWGRFVPLTPITDVNGNHSETKAS